MDIAEQKKHYKKEVKESAEVKTDHVDGAVDTKSRIHCLSIVGQIEGHYILPEGQKATKYEHIIPELVDIEEDPETDGLLIILNTMGGDVEAGLALAEMIASMRKPTVSLVLGGGHSIGVPLATAAKTSFIVPSATMTLHPVRITGTVLGIWQSFDYLSRMQKRVTDFVVAHSHVTEERFLKMLTNTNDMANDVGTIVDGKSAVECGLIDKLGGLSSALAALHEMIAEAEAEK